MKKLTLFCLLSVITAIEGKIPGELENLEYIECTLIPQGAKTFQETSNAPQSYPQISNLNGSSANWSGYVAATSLNSPKSGSATYVTGTWTAPALTSTPDDSYCFVWVGLDGYQGNTTEQIGTSHNWINGAQTDFAWFEMYPAGSYLIANFPVNAGDVIVASVEYKKGGQFVLSLSNLTRSATTTIPSTYTLSPAAARSSAEWIVEAPSYNGVLPLADFGKVHFTHCACTINDKTGGVNDSKWRHGALIMVDDNNKVKAYPSYLSGSGHSLSISWEQE